MTDDKYQITKKAQYLNLLLLKDELQLFDRLLSEAPGDTEGWLAKLRATRSVFLALNNVKDAADKIQIGGTIGFVKKTRALKKDLLFAKHFRNRGIGHLNDTLLKRAVQWSPQIFYDVLKDNENIKLVEAQRAIIESCINSYIDKNGIQKIFGTEIDLMYPPNAKKFYSYLSLLIKKSIDWLAEASEIIMEVINHHTDEDIHELSVIAGQTNFNLNEEAVFSYSIEEYRLNMEKSLEALEEIGTDPEVLEFIRENFEV